MIELSKHRIVGLTGMSGAGKSTVGREFAAAGFCVIDCDRAAREVTAAGSPFLAELAEKFSADLLLADGTLDRKKTAALIFTQPEKRLFYNKIIYPYIAYNILSKVKRADSDILLDAPTLFEARLDPICDKIVSVCADRAVCAERIMLRDGISRELAEARLSSQHDIAFFRERSDLCIENNGTEQQLRCEALRIIGELKGAT